MTKLIRTLSVVLIPLGLLLNQTASAADYGTPADAKAMLEKAAVELKQDKAKALEMFNKGEGGFKVRDLYVFCGGLDGKFTAHPKLVGQSLKDLKVKSGKWVSPSLPLGDLVRLSGGHHSTPPRWT